MTERIGLLGSVYKRIPRKLVTSVGAGLGAGAIAVTSASIAESPIHLPTFDRSGDFISRQVAEPPSFTPTVLLETSTSIPTLTTTPEPSATAEPTPTGTAVPRESFQGIPLGEGTRPEEPIDEDLRKSLVPEDSVEATPESESVRKEAWWENEIPVRVRIPQIGIDETLIPMGTEPDPCPPEGACTLQTPDYGIATPDELLKKDDGTTVLIYAHSRWLNDKQPFNDLTNLNIGDIYEIESIDGEVAKFEVTELKLVVYGSEEADLYSAENRGIVQTSASTEKVDEHGNKSWDWLIDDQEVLSKATYLPEVIGGHMAWYVVAIPIEE